MSDLKNSIISILTTANKAFDHFDKINDPVDLIYVQKVGLNSETRFSSQKTRKSYSSMYNYYDTLNVPGGCYLGELTHYDISKEQCKKLLYLLNQDDGNKNINIRDNLVGISEKPIYYVNGELSINTKIAIYPSDDIKSYTFINVPKSTSVTKSLDMSIVPVKTLYYKCDCHDEECKDYFSCKDFCNRVCTCGGMQLPTIINFQPFSICESLTSYIKINTHEEYLKYVSIPHVFRYKHKYINHDLSLDFESYARKHMKYDDAKYKFIINEKVMAVSTNDDDGYPFSDEVLEMCVKYVYPVIEEVLVKPEYSENMYQDIEMIKNLIRKHITSSIGIAFNV